MAEWVSAIGVAVWLGASRGRKLAVGCVLATALGLALSACQIGPGNLNLVVNTTADGHDAHPGDGVCEMTVGRHNCSLRAAIEEANASITQTPVVTVPARRYVLTDGPLISHPTSGVSVIRASQPGAAVVVHGGSIVFEATGGRTLVSGLGVSGASGPGFEVASAATLIVVSGSAHDDGIGFAVDGGGSGLISETTLSDNAGPGVQDAGSFSSVFATITANGAGGITGAGTTALKATIVGHQVAGPDCASAVTSQGFNLDSDGTCGLGVFGDISDHAPQLGGLGTTAALPVHKPQVGSVVVNAIPTGDGPCTPSAGFTDELGRPRPVGTGCDIGAVEASFAPLTLTVNSSADDDDVKPGDGICRTAENTCTLRAAVDETNAYPSAGDTIDIDLGAADIGLHGGGAPDVGIDVLDDVTIHGNGATIDGHEEGGRLLDVAAPTSIDHLTVTNAHISESGAGIEASAPMTLDHVTVTNNTANDVHGGGIDSSSDLTLIDSTVSNNRCTGPGSGISVTGGNTTITDSTITGNFGAADDDSPGLEDQLDAPAVAIFGGTATISGTTISGNTAGLTFPNGAAGLLLDTSSATVTNSTISNNSEQLLFMPVHQTGGVGVVVRSGSARFVDDTIAGNTGSPDINTHLPTGPSIEAEGSLTMVGTIVSAPPGLACAAPLPSSGGYNIVSDTSCGFSGTGDRQSTDALLGGLGDNGGPTQTQVPGTGSPAIDAVPVGTAGLCDGSVATDQRGVTRPAGPACDIGSVEQ